MTYLVGTAVTVFLSNDATAVVLTPAVAAVGRAAQVESPLPLLLICAFIANAASFVLPISNPANLVIYGSHMPGLLQWAPRFALPSVLSIAATFGALWLTQRRALRRPIAQAVTVPTLSRAGSLCAVGIASTSVALLVASVLKWQLGLPTALAGVVTAAAVLLQRRGGAGAIVRRISWGVLPLVAGLFVLVQGLDRTGVLHSLTALMRAVAQAPGRTLWGVGGTLAILSNLMNNLPVGLIVGEALNAARASPQLTGAALIGVDLGPNLSVTGSLATILWLSSLRRDGHHISGWTFLKLGTVVMPPALLLALVGLWLTG